MPDKFGALLRKLRRAADKTLGEIAEAAGVSIVYLSDVERSNRSPFNTERILKIAGLSVDPLPLIEAADWERGVIEYDLTSAAPLQAGVVSDLVAGLQRGGVTDERLRRIPRDSWFGGEMGKPTTGVKADVALSYSKLEVMPPSAIGSWETMSL